MSSREEERAEVLRACMAVVSKEKRLIPTRKYSPVHSLSSSISEPTSTTSNISKFLAPMLQRRAEIAAEAEAKRSPSLSKGKSGSSVPESLKSILDECNEIPTMEKSKEKSSDSLSDSPESTSSRNLSNSAAKSSKVTKLNGSVNVLSKRNLIPVKRSKGHLNLPEAMEKSPSSSHNHRTKRCASPTDCSSLSDWASPGVERPQGKDKSDASAVFRENQIFITPSEIRFANSKNHNSYQSLTPEESLQPKANPSERTKNRNSKNRKKTKGTHQSIEAALKSSHSTAWTTSGSENQSIQKSELEDPGADNEEKVDQSKNCPGLTTKSSNATTSGSESHKETLKFLDHLNSEIKSIQESLRSETEDLIAEKNATDKSEDTWESYGNSFLSEKTDPRKDDGSKASSVKQLDIEKPEKPSSLKQIIEQKNDSSKAISEKQTGSEESDSSWTSQEYSLVKSAIAESYFFKREESENSEIGPKSGGSCQKSAEKSGPVTKQTSLQISQSSKSSLSKQKEIQKTENVQNSQQTSFGQSLNAKEEPQKSDKSETSEQVSVGKSSNAKKEASKSEKSGTSSQTSFGKHSNAKEGHSKSEKSENSGKLAKSEKLGTSQQSSVGKSPNEIEELQKSDKSDTSEQGCVGKSSNAKEEICKSDKSGTSPQTQTSFGKSSNAKEGHSKSEKLENSWKLAKSDKRGTSQQSSVGKSSNEKEEPSKSDKSGTSLQRLGGTSWNAREDHSKSNTSERSNKLGKCDKSEKLNKSENSNKSKKSDNSSDSSEFVRNLTSSLQTSVGKISKEKEDIPKSDKSCASRQTRSEKSSNSKIENPKPDKSWASEHTSSTKSSKGKEHIQKSCAWQVIQGSTPSVKNTSAKTYHFEVEQAKSESSCSKRNEKRRPVSKQSTVQNRENLHSSLKSGKSQNLQHTSLGKSLNAKSLKWQDQEELEILPKSESGNSRKCAKKEVLKSRSVQSRFPDPDLQIPIAPALPGYVPRRDEYLLEKLQRDPGHKDVQHGGLPTGRIGKDDQIQTSSRFVDEILSSNTRMYTAAVLAACEMGDYKSKSQGKHYKSKRKDKSKAQERHGTRGRSEPEKLEDELRRLERARLGYEWERLERERDRLDRREERLERERTRAGYQAGDVLYEPYRWKKASERRHRERHRLESQRQRWDMDRLEHERKQNKEKAEEVRHSWTSTEPSTLL